MKIRFFLIAVLLLSLQIISPVSSRPMDPLSAFSPFQNLYDHYFKVKDALVKSDAASAATNAAALYKALEEVDMNSFTSPVRSVWIKVEKGLKENAEYISKNKNLDRQRNHFIALSENMHMLMQADLPEETVYYQFCPMANDGKGANWLSLESKICNPYYGSAMMSCGRIVETIKKQ